MVQGKTPLRAYESPEKAIFDAIGKVGNSHPALVYVTAYFIFRHLVSSPCIFVGKGIDYACRILDDPSINLMRTHSSGVVDNATAYQNIVDTCNGRVAYRSR